MDRVKVTSMVHFGVSIEDAGIYLAGCGDSTVVLRTTADSSSQLADAVRNGWVRKDPVARAGFWPFSSPAASRPPPTYHPPPAVPDGQDAVAEEVRSLKGQLEAMTSLIQRLVDRGSAVHPQAAVPVASGTGEKDLVFIPSKVVPDAKANVKVPEAVTHERDVDAGREALRKLRRGK